jgi:hypothetical protein
MSVQSFGIIGVPILGFPLGNLENLKKKCHLDVAPIESHRVYYREGSGASSQRLWTV